MEDLPFSAYLEALSTKAAGAPVAKRKKSKDLGDEIVKFLDFYDEMTRMALRPLAPEEKSLIERLVKESMSGAVPPDMDTKAISKLLMHLMMAADEEGEDGAMPVFLLGMAYERLRTKLTLLPT